VSCQAKELELVLLLIKMSLVLLIMMAVVEVNVSIYYSFVEIRNFYADFGLEIRILTPS